MLRTLASLPTSWRESVIRCIKIVLWVSSPSRVIAKFFSPLQRGVKHGTTVIGHAELEWVLIGDLLEHLVIGRHATLGRVQWVILSLEVGVLSVLAPMHGGLTLKIQASFSQMVRVGSIGLLWGLALLSLDELAERWTAISLKIWRILGPHILWHGAFFICSDDMTGLILGGKGKFSTLMLVIVRSRESNRFTPIWNPSAANYLIQRFFLGLGGVHISSDRVGVGEVVGVVQVDYFVLWADWGLGRGVGVVAGSPRVRLKIDLLLMACRVLGSVHILSIQVGVAPRWN